MNRRQALRVVPLLALAPTLVSAQATPASALKGYDPVAYFTEGRARKGSPSIVHDFDGLRYHFATARHRDLFVADPVRYLPQFGGNCAANMAKGIKYEADPEHWVVADGKLYVFGGAGGPEAFRRESLAITKTAAQHWNAGVGRR